MSSELSKPTVKRKRTKEEDPSVRISGKLHHCAKEVKKAAKKAKDFEIRKLVKRLKGLRSKATAQSELEDLEEQLACLKDIDHEAVANTALKTKLKKDKRLAENADLEAAITKELAQVVTPPTPGSNLAKVQGRLLSSKVLAMEVHSVVEGIRLAIFPELKKPSSAKEVSEGEGDEDIPAPPAKKARLAGVESGDEYDAFEEEEASDIGGQLVLDEDDEGVDDAGWESGSVGRGPDDEEEEPTSDEESEGDSDSEDEDEEDNKPSRERPSKNAPSTSKVVAKSKSAGESTFLPSLSVGFTRGDSDASDVEDDDVAKADVKKNRRGQRARQAIWEKKYGRNANHVKKQETTDPRNVGSRNAAKKPFGKASDVGRPRPPAYTSNAPRPQASWSRPSAPSGPPAQKIEDKPLHPSWEAKRKLKDRQNPGILAPQGKKIVF